MNCYISCTFFICWDFSDRIIERPAKEQYHKKIGRSIYGAEKIYLVAKREIYISLCV
jgi:hypothetical protein